MNTRQTIVAVVNLPVSLVELAAITRALEMSHGTRDFIMEQAGEKLTITKQEIK
jgi:hypothetical protein